jgi:hypothetical protein
MLSYTIMIRYRWIFFVPASSYFCPFIYGEAGGHVPADSLRYPVKVSVPEKEQLSPRFHDLILPAAFVQLENF